MDNLVNETNGRLQLIIDNLLTIKEEYDKKILDSTKKIDKELELVNKYKEEFFTSKEKIEKMNSDIEGFEADYQSLVDRFKNDELANILISANKEISAKIAERKRKILKDKAAMNELVEKAEEVKKKLIKLTAEKRAIEMCLERINDSYDYYRKALTEIIEFSTINKDNLCGKTKSKKKEKDLDIDSLGIAEKMEIEEPIEEVEIENNIETVEEENVETSIIDSTDDNDFINLEDFEENDELNINFDDSIEDDESLYEKENEE